MGGFHVKQGGGVRLTEVVKIGGGGHFSVKNQICLSELICICMCMRVTRKRPIPPRWGQAYPL